MFDEFTDEETTALTASSRLAAGRNPAAVASMLQIARRMNIPTSFIRHDDGKQAQQVLQQQDFLSLKDTAPKTAKFAAASPDNAAIIGDDLHGATKFESLINSARNGWQDTKDGFHELGLAFKRSVPAFTKGLSGTSLFMDKLTPFKTTDGESSGIYAQTEQEWQDRETAAREKQAPAIAELQRPDMQYGERSSLSHSPLLFAATRFIENAPTQGVNLAGGIVTALGAPQVGLPMVVAGTALAFGAQGSDTYDEVLKKTGDDYKAKLAGIGTGLIEVLDGAADLIGGRFFAGKSLFKKAIQKELADRLVSNYATTAAGSAVKQTATNVGKGMAFEGLTEGVQGTSQEGVTNIATGESTSAKGYVKTFVENALPGMFGGLVLGGPAASRAAYSDKQQAQFIVSALTDPQASNEDKVKAMSLAYSDMKTMAVKGETVPPPSVAARSIISSMVTGDSTFATQSDNALQAHSNAAALDTMAELAKANKIIPRDAETAKIFFQSLKDEGISDVAIPVQRFVEQMQAQGLDPRAEAARITGNPESLNDALATGGDFHIPLESLITYVMPSDAYAGLRDDIRLHPDDWTAREASEWESTQAAQDFTDSLNAIQKADPVQAVYQEMLGELIGAQIPRGQAEIQAQMWADRYRTRATRLGVDPLELWQQSKAITVTRPLDPALAARVVSDPQFDGKLDAIRSNAIPEQGAIFGESLIDFVRKHGVRDDRGDLAAMDIDKGLPKFKKKALRPDGMELDRVRLLAVDEGYFTTSIDTTAFLDAISEGLAGRHTYSDQNIKQELMDKQQELEQLREGLDQAGIDLNQMDNAGVRQALNQMSGEALYQVSNEVDQQLSLWADKKLKSHVEMNLGNASSLLQQFGVPDLPIHLTQGILSKAINKKHNVTVEDLKGITEAVQFPIAILNSKKGEGHRVVITELHHDNGNIIVAIELNTERDGLVINDITSVYPKYDSSVAHWVFEDGLLLAYDKTKGRKYLESLPASHSRSLQDITTLNASVYDISEHVNTLFQGATKKRGFFRPSLREIGLLKDANLSTFLHETGHAWLEELRIDSQTEGVDQQVIDDWSTVKAWLGIDGDSNEITVEQHEQFARGFEAYLSEGNAPSNALTDAFQRFAGWLKQVYSDLTKLDVKLTPEVRQVMDRLIATDEEISAARVRQGLVTELFATAEEAGMNEAEFKLYRSAAEKEHATAVERLNAKLMKELSREHSAWWKEERASLRKEVEAEAKAEPVYEVSNLLLTGKLFDGTEFENVIKLNKADLVRMYGDKFPAKLPRGFGSVMYAENGMSPDIVAEQFGFASGDEMIRAILDAPKMKVWIEAETDYRMRQTHGDMRMDGSIAEEAMNAIHNERRGEIMLKELAAIRRKRNDVKPMVNAAMKEIKKGADSLKTPPLAAYRDAAKAIIGKKPLHELSPIYYSRAEKKAGDDAVKLFKKGDYSGAQQAKEQQVLNHFLYIEASKARQESKKIRDYAVKMMTKDSLGKLGKAGDDFLQQVRTILEAHGFQRVSNKELGARVESLERFISRMKEEENIDIPVDPDLLAGELPNYKRMTIDELRALYDTVKALEKVAQFINTIRIKGERVAFEWLENEAVNSINELHTDKKPTRRTDFDKSWVESKWDGIKNLVFGVIRPQALIEVLDGDSVDQQGIFHDALWTPYNDASAKENSIKAQILPQINAILDSNPKASERYRDQFQIEALGEKLSVYTMIGIVLNMGNISNMDKLMRGGVIQGQDKTEISPAALDEIINHLTKSEMDMIQGLWDMVETLKPEMRVLEKRMYGIEPEWIDAQELTTKHGVYRGGYWPVVFDADYSKAGQKQAESATINEALSVMPFSQAFTKHGHLKSRTQAAYPMLFDWQQVASRHLDQVITDIAYREFIITSSKILRSQPIKTAILDRLGNGYHSELNAWLKGIVDREQSLSKSDSQLMALRNTARTNATVAYLGLKVANAIVDTVVTPMQAWSRVDASSLATGIKDTLTDYSANKEQIQAMSPYMDHLWMNLDRDLSDGMKQLAGKSGVIDKIKMVSMESRAWAYELGAMMIWKGGFIDAQSKHGLSGKDAVNFADDIVRGTSDAGRKGDLNTWERNKNLKEFTMFMGPMTIAVNQIAKAVRVGKRRGISNPMVYKTLIGVWVSNGLMYDLLLNKGPDSEDDKEKWLSWMMAKFAMFPLGSIPFIRDLASLIENRASGEPSMSRSVPMVETGKAVVNAATASYAYLTEGEKGGKALKNLNMAAGLVVGLPASQINISGQFIADVMSGDYEPQHAWSPVQDIFFRRKKQ